MTEEVRRWAWLTGIGAMTVGNAILFSIAFELWADRVLRFPLRPEFEFVGLPSYAFGAAVAVAASGRLGVAALVAVASLWMVFIPFDGHADTDVLIRHAWDYAGIVLGLVIAGVRPRHFHSAILRAIGVFGLLTTLLGTVLLPWCYGLGAAGCLDKAAMVTLLWNIAAALASGVIAATAPIRNWIAAGAILALPSALVLLHQTSSLDANEPARAAASAGGLLAGVALVLAAWVAHGFIRRPDAPSGARTLLT